MKYNKKDILKFMQENPRAIISDLAKNYGITRQAMSEGLKKMGIKWGELRDESRKNQIIKYKAEHPNATKKEIANALGISYEVLIQDLKRYKIKFSKGYDDSRAIIKKEELEGYIASHPNVTKTELANHYKVHYNTMLRTLYRYNISAGRTREKKKIEWGEEEFRKYIEQNPMASGKDLANEFNVSVTTIRNYLSKYQIELQNVKKRGPSKTKEEIEQYISEHPDTSAYRMAKEMNLSATTINRYLKIYNIHLEAKKLKTKISRDELMSYIKSHPKSNQKTMAADLGVSMTTIDRYIKRYNIPYEKKNKQKEIADEQIMEYLKEHPQTSCKKMAYDFNVSAKTISKILRKLNIKLENGTRIDIKKEDVERFLKDNPDASQSDISRYFDISHSTISRKLKEFKIKPQRAKGMKPKVKREDIEEYILKHPDTNQQQMTEVFGVSNTTMSRYLNRYGIKLPNNGLQPGKRISKKDMEDFIHSNPDTTQRQIAEHFGIASSTVCKYIKLYEINIKPKTKKIKLTKQEMILKVIEMLNSIHGLSVKRLQAFLKQRGIEVSEEEILKYQHELQKEKEESEEER